MTTRFGFDGLQARPLSIDDVPEVASLCRQYERFWEVPMKTPDAQVHDDLTDPSLVLASDSIGFWLDGDLIAYGYVWHRPSTVKLERAYLLGLVHPDYRGRGFGRQLLGWQIERGRELLGQSENNLPRYIRVDEWDWVEDAHSLYARMGLTPVRYFKDMIRPLDSEIPPRSTGGFEVLPMDRRLDAEILRAWNESFADHWGSTPVDTDSYEHRMEMDGTDLGLSLMAISEGEVVGISLNAHYPDDVGVIGRSEGWIEVLGVRPDWRGRGIASSLIEESCRGFRTAGHTHAALHVDSDNPSGAFGLYERLGFAPTVGTITSEIAL